NQALNRLRFNYVLSLLQSSFLSAIEISSIYFLFRLLDKELKYRTEECLADEISDIYSDF
ncbi:MAG TPA: hypothetical protein VE226_06290, partial [Nitrososphaeraceae archaeon]|nr:hypothetical protein [Nitrososphaeraceae archaeon]